MLKTQKQFFPEWSRRTNIPQKDLKTIYQEMVSMIYDSVNEADESKTIIPDIGVIHVKPRPPYVGRNPITKDPISIDTQRRVHITVREKLKKLANEEYRNN